MPVILPLSIHLYIRLLLGIVFLFISQSMIGTTLSRLSTHPFISTNVEYGAVMGTNDFMKGNYPNGFRHNRSQSIALQMGWKYNPFSWQYQLYPKAYRGFGVRYSFMGDPAYLGNPISLYYMQGSNIWTFSDRLALRYEANLGMAFGWKEYDPLKGNYNIATGGLPVSVLINLYLKLGYRINPFWEAELTAGLSHFSNGAYRLPNMGINQVPFGIGMRYYLNPSKERTLVAKEPLPLFKRSLDWELSFYMTKRQRIVPDKQIEERLRFNDINYMVFNLSLSPMLHHTRLVKFGPSVDIFYDESTNVKLWFTPDKSRMEYQLAPFLERWNIGLSARGEIVLPGLSFYGQLGYNLFDKSNSTGRFYQIVGAKCYLNKELYINGGVRACNFSIAQCAFIGLGYTFHHYLK